MPQGPRGDSRKERRREGGRRRRRRVGRRGPLAGTRDGGRLRGGAGGCRCCFRFRFYFRASRFGWGYLYRRNRLRNLRCSVPCAAPSRLVVGVGVVVVFAVSKVLARARRLREVRAHRRRLRPHLPVQEGVWQSRRRRQGAAVGAAGTRRKRRWSEGNWSSSDLFRSCFPSQQQRHRSQASLLPLEVPEPASSSPACELMRNRAAFAFVQHWEYINKKKRNEKNEKNACKKTPSLSRFDPACRMQVYIVHWKKETKEALSVFVGICVKVKKTKKGEENKGKSERNEKRKHLVLFSNSAQRILLSRVLFSSSSPSFSLSKSSKAAPASARTPRPRPTGPRPATRP